MDNEPINFYMRKAEFGWLSNFERAPQTVYGVTYPTNEHFYQAHKAHDPEVRAWIAAAPSPWLAMKAGRSLREGEMTPEWDAQKVEVMRVGLMAKFRQNAHLRERLLATGDRPIHEASPTDHFWGNAPKPDGSPGDDWLGRLLMEVRAALSKEAPQ